VNTARARDGDAFAIHKMNVLPKRENKNNLQKEQEPKKIVAMRAAITKLE
jgi:hypothetical protein